MSKSNSIPPTPNDKAYHEGDYKSAHVEHAHEIEVDEPYTLFAQWLKSATAKEANDSNAMAIASVDENGMPDVRMVLLKDYDPQGFVFYSNSQSGKGGQLEHNPKAALLFHWKSLRRQVRIRGDIVRVSDVEADAYFQSRARSSQIGAWASEQSRPLTDSFALEKRVAEFTLKFGLGKIPRPPQWVGYRLIPQSFEFWRDRAFRLHDRVKFNRDEAGAWTRTKLFP